jgi:lysozyme
MDPARRRELTRYGAPALFLAAVTVAVLLVKAGLDSGSGSEANTSPLPTTTAAVTTPPVTTKLVLTTPTTSTAVTSTTTSTTTTTTGGQYYVIQAGDTLGAIAAKYKTSVDQLLTLNPGLDPNALQPGARIRVG